jgi:hypothetical protein
MQASPGSAGATWACSVRWMVSECSTVLLVAVNCGHPLADLRDM